MTPSITFQWPLSPSGTFQLEKSFPLNRAAKPAGGWVSAACNTDEQAAAIPKTIKTIREMRLSVRTLRSIEVFMAWPDLSVTQSVAQPLRKAFLTVLSREFAWRSGCAGSFSENTHELVNATLKIQRLE